MNTKAYLEISNFFHKLKIAIKQEKNVKKQDIRRQTQKIEVSLKKQ